MNNNFKDRLQNKVYQMEEQNKYNNRRKSGCLKNILGIFLILIIIGSIGNSCSDKKKTVVNDAPITKTESIPTAPSKPQESVKDYKTTIAPIMSTIGQKWGEVSKLMSLGEAIYQEDNKMNLAVCLTDIRMQWSKYSNTVADEQGKQLKTQLDSARDKQLQSIDKLIQGLDNMDGNAISEATRLLKESNDIVNKIN